MNLSQRVDAAIDAALVERVAGCVVLVRQNGKDVFRRAAGLADREANVPVREDTIFRYASVTKPFVATAALRMVELGLLGMPDVHFYVTDRARLAAPYVGGPPPVPAVEPRTGGPGDLGLSPSRIFNRDAPQSGGGGMAGTTDEMLRLIDIYNGNGGLL